jgi:hypothetical protein
MGFRSDQSAVDNVRIVKQMYEKCHKYSITIYSIFVGFKQAFDSVNKRAIYGR